jgi:hypothetical protein
MMAEELAKEIPKRFYFLARHFWPGPLTIILEAPSRVSTDLRKRDRGFRRDYHGRDRTLLARDQGRSGAGERDRRRVAGS